MHEHERWEDASGSYVLGALTDDERVAYEAHLRTCATCRAEVEELRVAAQALPVSPPPMVPPPALKARIMAEVEREAKLLAGAQAPPRARRSWWRWSLPAPALAALASVALLVGLGIGGLVFGASERTVEFASTIPRAAATLEVSGDGATLAATGLPPAPEGQAYMVWVKRPGRDPEPTSALFTPRADGSATASVRADLGDVEAVLVNTESLAGDATAPTSAPLLTAELT